MSVQFYCERCGGLFNRPAKGNKRMFCDDCKPQAEKLYQAEYYKRRKGEIIDLRAALAAKEQELRDAYALAYIGEHRFPDLTWKSRAAEMVAALAAKDAEIEKLKAEIETLAWNLGGILLALTAKDAEIERLKAAIKTGLELMPLGTSKRADWLVQAGDMISVDPGQSQTSLETKFENRGHLMDAYVLALAEIADGREKPVEFARSILRQGSWTLIESAKDRTAPEQKLATCVWKFTDHIWTSGCGERSIQSVREGKYCPFCGKHVEVRE